jgi:light-regulated signal transduction histidine kinase (bacteriophytochrome)/ActR/RegA family two-component response regulator
MNLDLTNCDSEPIRVPGAIQPHGVLIAVNLSSQKVSHVSANSQQVLRSHPEDLLGLSLDELKERHLAGFTMEFAEGRPVYQMTWQAVHEDGGWDAITHRSGTHLMLEFEPAGTPMTHLMGGLYYHLQAALARIERVHSLIQMADTAVQEVRRVTGFDRVMMYRFDPTWNGEVISEAKRDDLEPFLGLHYPASDIPRQARELYSTNWLRFIPDRDYVPCSIINANGGDAVPLDLSQAVLRSVSPVHIEYLRNMGVGASMSISIMKDDRLWGLIACHHYSPRYVHYDIRKASELLGHFLSLQISRVESAETEHERTRMNSCKDRLIRRLLEVEDLPKAFMESSPTLLDLLPAEGVAIVDDQSITRIGQTPSEEEIVRLSTWLRHKRQELYFTDCLSDSFGRQLLASVSAGVLAIQVGQRHVSQIIWFRTERSRTVHWAGDPRKFTLTKDGVERLSPRGSFELWVETVKGHSEPWSSDQIHVVLDFRDELVRFILRRSEALADLHEDLQVASTEQQKAFEAERIARMESDRLNRIKDDFVAVLSHELRTPLNSILGWAQLLKLSTASDRSEFTEGLNIIEQNAKSQASIIDDLLDINRIISGKLRLDLQDLDLAPIIEGAIDSISVAAAAKGIRLERLIDPMPGTKTTGDPNRLRQIAWNLLSNAVKFTPKNGKVQILLKKIDSHVEFIVCDSGIGIKREVLPYVFERYRQADTSIARQYGGLGLGLSIVRNLVELHGGVIRVESGGEGQGTTFTVALPIRVLTGDRSDPGSLSQTSDEKVSLRGIRVLVVDDEKSARELVRLGLVSFDAEVVCLGSAGEAIEVLSNQPFDLIISDIGMPGCDGYSFIRQWRLIEGQRGRDRIPAIALTAYARPDDRKRALLSGFNAHLAKPIDVMELIAVAAGQTNRTPQ